MYRIQQATAGAVLRLTSKASLSNCPSSATIPAPATIRERQVKFNFNEVFSQENKNRTIQELQRVPSDMLVKATMGNTGRRGAAVLVPLCYDLQGRPSVLLNLRSKALNQFKGEICYPGGVLNPADNGDFAVAALRETEEEMGIQREEIETWSTLPYVPIVISSMVVVPVLGLIPRTVDPKNLRLDPGEVQAAFTVPLEHLCDELNWSLTKAAELFKKDTLLKESHLPAFQNLGGFVPGGEEGIEMYGLTGIITHFMLLNLVPQVYQRAAITSVEVVPNVKTQLLSSV